MIPTLPFPRRASIFASAEHVTTSDLCIPRVHLPIRPLHGIAAWWNSCPCARLGASSITRHLVITTVSRNLRNRCCHLAQHLREYFFVAAILVRGPCSAHFAGGFVHANMQRPPCASPDPALLAHLPFTHTIHFQPCCIDHQMQTVRPELGDNRQTVGGDDATRDWNEQQAAVS